jgi:putative nucleotidyltransferase with HDIG domain
VLAGLAALAAAAGLGAPLQRLAGDALQRAAARLPPPAPAALPDAALVVLDPQSLREHPDWPWPRDLYARTSLRLSEAGARVIAFDIDFSTPRDPADDAAFAAAAERSGRVVLAAFRQAQELDGGGTLEVANIPIPQLAGAAAGVGSVLMPVDPDGVVRRAPRASSIAGRTHVSLAEVALAVALGRAPEARGSGTFPVDYRRAAPAIPLIPIARVLDASFDPSLVAGRVVFVGATAAEFQDLWATPLGPARPGVWIQALVYRTLAAREAGAPVLRTAPPAAAAAAALLACLAAAGVAGASRRRRAPGLLLLFAGALACDLWLLVRTGLLLDPVLPLGAAGLRYVLGLEGVRERLRRVLAQRETSLSALARVGEAATAAPTAGGDPLGLALALLGDVVEASGAALLRATPEGELDGRRLEWRRRGDREIGDLARAREVLAEGSRRVFQEGGGLAVYEPLRSGAVAVGVLVVECEGARSIDAVQLRTVGAVGAQIALSAENLRLLEGLRRTFDSSIEAVATAIEARDGYTESHCRRLAVYSAAMAERLGLPPAEIEAVRLGALLHDVGKIGIRDEVLLKPGSFTPAERAEMQRHAEIGHRVVIPIFGLSSTTVACVRHHHEWWDGNGYPDGLAGEAIPLGARIVAVVDVWDALSTVRPYKRAYAPAQVRELLEKGRGGQFDPQVVEVFLRLLAEDGDELAAIAEGRA